MKLSQKRGKRKCFRRPVVHTYVFPRLRHHSLLSNGDVTSNAHQSDKCVYQEVSIILITGLTRYVRESEYFFLVSNYGKVRLISGLRTVRSSRWRCRWFPPSFFLFHSAWLAIHLRDTGERRRQGSLYEWATNWNEVKQLKKRSEMWHQPLFRSSSLLRAWFFLDLVWSLECLSRSSLEVNKYIEEDVICANTILNCRDLCSRRLRIINSPPT